LCVSGREEVAEKATKIGFRMVSIEEPESAASKIIKSLISKKQLPGIRTLYPAIHVPGGFGVEPILYLFGPSAKEVSERSLLLSDALKG
jgi:predicted fused transcriptional regulator/phosphomethylpyrimidine kinase